MVDFNMKIPAIEKLLDYVASGIGTVSGPMLARWKARAEADAMLISAQGQADSIRLIASAQAEARKNFAEERSTIQGGLTIGKEIQARLEFQEKKRQSNITSVVKMAAEELGDKRVENRPADDDWAARFFGDVQDVTSEHMQRMWSKILAGEVETPGRTSLHTLAILKNMTQKDAELFEQVSQFIFDTLLFTGENYEKIPGYPEYQSVIKLESYGLVTIVSGVVRSFGVKSTGVNLIGDKVAYRISGGGADKVVRVQCIPLTPQGIELFNLTEHPINEDYIKEIARLFKSEGNFKLEAAPVLEKFVGRVRIGPWTLVNPPG